MKFQDGAKTYSGFLSYFRQFTGRMMKVKLGKSVTALCRKIYTDLPATQNVWANFREI